MGAGYDEAQLAGLLMHLGRAAYTGDPRDDLSPAQRMCLRYFCRANRFSRTVSGFADFHATTRGTASLTVAGLVERGLLRRHPSRLDGRSRRLDLTERGRELVNDSLSPLEEAVKQLPRTHRALLGATLDRLTRDLAKARGSATFGTCGQCVYFSEGPAVTNVASRSHCNLFGEPLNAEDVETICLNFKAAG